MRYALPPGETAVVERAVFGCLALGLATLAALVLLEGALRSRAASFAVLGLLFVAFTVSFALVTAGTLPRARRVRLAIALCIVALAAAIAPMSTSFAIVMVPPIAIGLALALGAPATARRWARAGAALLAMYAVLHRIDIEVLTHPTLSVYGAHPAWRLSQPTAMLAGIACFAVAYGLGAIRARKA